MMQKCLQSHGTSSKLPLVLLGGGDHFAWLWSIVRRRKMIRQQIQRLCQALLLAMAIVSAAPITGLVSTGGATPGNLEPNWTYAPTLSSSPTFVSPYVTQTDSSGFPFASWIANSTTSRWISPNVGYGVDTGIWGDAPGLYTFRLVFNLPANAIPNTATFTYQIANDNLLHSVWLNGQMIQSSPVGWYNAFTGPITIGPTPGLFLSTGNILDVIVVNTGIVGTSEVTTWNPVALRFEVLSSNVDLLPGPPPNVIPEPGTMLMMAAGLGAIGLIRYRRWKRS